MFACCFIFCFDLPVPGIRIENQKWNTECVLCESVMNRSHRFNMLYRTMEREKLTKIKILNRVHIQDARKFGETRTTTHFHPKLSSCCWSILSVPFSKIFSLLEHDRDSWSSEHFANFSALRFCRTFENANCFQFRASTNWSNSPRLQDANCLPFSLE